MTIDETIALYQQNKSQVHFKAIAQSFEHIFRYWYRHVQRFVDMDRQTLLSEFNLILLRTLNKYDSALKVHDNGFERYLRSAAKKHSLSLRRKSASSKRCEKLPQWDLVDPKSAQPFDAVDLADALNSCIKDRLERNVAGLRLMGWSVNETRDRLKLSDFQYRSAMGRVRENNQLRLAMSRD